MVLLLKQWKSRSSPGFETGVSKNPFATFQKAAAGMPSGGFLFGEPRFAQLARGGPPSTPSPAEPGSPPTGDRRTQSPRAFRVADNDTRRSSRALSTGHPA